MSQLLLDESSVAHALGEAVVTASPARRTFFQYEFSSTTSCKVDLAFTGTLKPEEAGTNDLQPISLANRQFVTQANGGSFANGEVAVTDQVLQFKYDYATGLQRGIFYIDNLPLIVVPRVDSIITGAYVGTSWRLRLWSWSA